MPRFSFVEEDATYTVKMSAYVADTLLVVLGRNKPATVYEADALLALICELNAYRHKLTKKQIDAYNY